MEVYGCKLAVMSPETWVYKKSTGNSAAAPGISDDDNTTFIEANLQNNEDKYVYYLNDMSHRTVATHIRVAILLKLQPICLLSDVVLFLYVNNDAALSITGGTVKMCSQESMTVEVPWFRLEYGCFCDYGMCEQVMINVKPKVDDCAALYDVFVSNY